MAHRVTAIIVTYNSAGEIAAALTALRPAHEAGELDCVVVDNVSRDDTVAIVRRDHAWATMVESPVNLGYGRGLNAGLARATTPYVLFMNPDAVIAPPDIAKLTAFLDEHPRVGVVAPAIIEGDGALQTAGVMPTPTRILRHAAGVGRGIALQRTIHPGEAPFATNWLCGALLLARTALIQELGGFDPMYFLYFEETDLCRRVAQKGFELWAVGEAVAHHEGSVSAKQTGQSFVASCIAEHYFQSRFYYLRKFHGLAAAVFTEVTEYGLLAVRSVTSRLRGRVDEGFRERRRGPFLSMPKPVASLPASVLGPTVRVPAPGTTPAAARSEP